jgi:integrase
MLLSELVDQAILTQPFPQLSSATIKQYRCSLANLLLFLGDHEMSALLTPDLAAWCDWVHMQPHIRPTTGNSYRRSIRALLRRVDRADLAKGITLRIEPRTVDKAISEEDFARLLSVASVRDAAILLFLAESGCRRGAISRLKVSDLIIAQVGNEYRVAARTMQKGRHGGRPITVFAGHRAGWALHRWLSSRPFPNAEYVFTSLQNGQPLRPASVSDIIHRLKKRAGIPKSRFVCCHAFRHRFAKAQLERLDLKTVSELMGHSSTRVTERYINHTVDDLANAFFGDDLFTVSFPE